MLKKIQIASIATFIFLLVGCTHERLNINRGLDLIEEEDYAAAIGVADKVIGRDKESYRAYALRGYAKQKAGNFNKALEDYKKDLEINPKFMGIYKIKSEYWFENKNYDKSIAEEQKILLVEPENQWAMHAIGYAYAEKNISIMHYFISTKH